MLLMSLYGHFNFSYCFESLRTYYYFLLIVSAKTLKNVNIIWPPFKSF